MRRDDGDRSRCARRRLEGQRDVPRRVGVGRLEDVVRGALHGDERPRDRIRSVGDRRLERRSADREARRRRHRHRLRRAEPNRERRLGEQRVDLVVVGDVVRRAVVVVDVELGEVRQLPGERSGGREEMLVERALEDVVLVPVAVVARSPVADGPLVRRLLPRFAHDVRAVVDLRGEAGVGDDERVHPRVRVRRHVGLPVAGRAAVPRPVPHALRPVAGVLDDPAAVVDRRGNVGARRAVAVVVPVARRRAVAVRRLLIAVRNVVGRVDVVVGRLDRGDVVGLLRADEPGLGEPRGRGERRALVHQQLVHDVGRLGRGLRRDPRDREVREVVAAVHAGVPVLVRLAVAHRRADVHRHVGAVADEQHEAERRMAPLLVPLLDRRLDGDVVGRDADLRGLEDLDLEAGPALPVHERLQRGDEAVVDDHQHPFGAFVGRSAHADRAGCRRRRLVGRGDDSGERGVELRRGEARGLGVLLGRGALGVRLDRGALGDEAHADRRADAQLAARRVGADRADLDQRDLAPADHGAVHDLRRGGGVELVLGVGQVVLDVRDDRPLDLRRRRLDRQQPIGEAPLLQRDRRADPFVHVERDRGAARNFDEAAARRKTGMTERAGHAAALKLEDGARSALRRRLADHQAGRLEARRVKRPGRALLLERGGRRGRGAGERHVAARRRKSSVGDGGSDAAQRQQSHDDVTGGGHRWSLGRPRGAAAIE